MVAQGVDAREAWAACGQPNGEGGIQQIRKQGHKLRAPSPAPPPEPPATVAAGALGKGKPSAGFRLRKDQRKVILTQQAADTAEYARVFAAATAEWQRRVSAGQTGRGFDSADVVAASYKVPDGKKLSGQMLKNAVAAGRAGKPPPKRGPSPQLPDELVRGIAGYAQLKQVAGDEQGPRLLVGRAVAAVQGTCYEDKLQSESQRRHFLKKVRAVEGMESAKSECVDDRRWKWLTSGNLARWFEGYTKILHERGFIDQLPADKFEVVTIPACRAARMGNADESHQKLSSEGETAGPRANVYRNPALGNAGKRKVVCSKHASIMAWVNYAGECGGLHLMLATGAEAVKKGKAASTAAADDAQAIRIRPEWTFGIPRVIGKFGHEEEQIFEPSFIMNEKGGMEGNGLEQWVEHQIIPAYPNMAYDWTFDDDGSVLAGPVFLQLDAGPDRTTDCSLEFRQRMWLKGLILFPGLPNGTAANQTMDDLFGAYKTGCDERAVDIVSERITAAETDSSLVVKLDFADLGRVINGRPTDPDHLRPFSTAFTPEKILAAVARLGLNPIDLRTAISHRRVRDDSVEGTRTELVKQVRTDHEKTLEAAAALGLNTNVLTVAAPKTKSYVAGPSTAEAQYEALKENSSVGTMWWAVGAKAFNAPQVTEPAVARVQERLEEAATKKAQAADDWETLRLAARNVEQERVASKASYEDLNGEDLKMLVSFVFKAKKEKGVTEHKASKRAAVDFLSGLLPGEMQQLLLRTEPGVAAQLALMGPAVTAVVVGEPLPALMPPAEMVEG